MRCATRSVLASLLVILAAPAFAQDNWTLTTSDFKRSTVTLAAIDDTTARLTPAGVAETKVPLDRILRLDRSASTTPGSAKYTLLLHGGDRLGGEPGALKDDTLTWTSPAVGEIKLPLSKVAAISRLPLAAVTEEQRKEDQVMLSNHDIVRGVVAGIEDGKILMQSGGDTVPIPFASADAVLFASADAVLFASPAQAAASTARSWRIRFADGSLLTVPSVKTADAKLVFPAPGGIPNNPADTRSADLANVLGIEQLNGPVSWLSDRTPSINKQIPFNSETTYPAKMDRNVFGRPLRVGAQSFEKGIGVHANSTLTFPLNGTYKSFRTRYAIDTTSEAGKADVNLRILLDDRVVYEQKNVRAYRISPVVSINLGDAKALMLEVTAAAATDTQDRFDWIEAALVRDAAAADNGPATKP